MAEFENLDSGWSESEFQGQSFGDKRLEKRMLKVAEQLSSNLQLPIYAATKEWACAKAARCRAKVLPSNVTYLMF